jgi:N-acetylmuramic acid 6-phosphate etherase
LKYLTEMNRITENDSLYRNLEMMSTQVILESINNEDQIVPGAVQMAIPQIRILVDAIAERMISGGRLFYIGAGTSGRLGVVDASECPPTYGIPQGMVVGIIAGGYGAMFQAVEFAEDNTDQAWVDLQEHNINSMDAVVGIAASGTTPYVIGGIQKCREMGIVTGCITCNEGSPLAAAAEFPVEVPVGPEFVTGSTRMKSGTAQKLVLNMISTAVMIQLGRVEDNKMVNMQLTNEKLVDRGVKMLMLKSGLQSYEDAKKILLEFGSVKSALNALSK